RHQPRKILPDAVMQSLIDADRAQPAGVLEALRELASHDAEARDILGEIESLARSVEALGVLQPIDVVWLDGRWLVLEGHRRSIAAVIAGVATVPAHAVEDDDPLETEARAFAINVQRQDWTALEKAEALAHLVQLATHQDAGSEAVPGVAEAPRPDHAADAPPDADDEADAGVDDDRLLATRVRKRVCRMTGLSRDGYFRFLRLNRLSEGARRLGRRLTEQQLRPLVGLASEDQEMIVAVAVQRNLPGREIAALARIVRAGDEEEIRRRMAQLAGVPTGRPRVAPTWQALLHAVPENFPARVRALGADLAALEPRQRAERIRQIRRQAVMMRTAAEDLEACVDAFATQDAEAG
ncbi:MAG TPA: ParB N-terminal domain-containing protein, partial [Chloroflexota bacterium]|nr:ParB N-terminal domain-containing protein [Chloroflexota bacterium]